MTTTQTTGHHLKRLCYLLGTMIEQLEGAEPENALGRIEEYEDEAAELIKTTGLADEAEIRDEFRPVFKRTMLGWEEFGIGDTPHEKHPTYVSYQFTESSGMIHIRKFDALTAMGLAMPKLDPPPKGWQKSKPPPGSWAEKLQQQLGSMSRGPRFPEPDASFVQTLVMCLKGWRARAQWKLTSEIPDERVVIDDSSSADEWRQKILAGEEDNILSIGKAAGYIEMSDKTIYRMMGAGLPYTQPEGKPKKPRRIRKSDLLAWQANKHPLQEKK